MTFSPESAQGHVGMKGEFGSCVFTWKLEWEGCLPKLSWLVTEDGVPRVLLAVD